MRFMSIVEGHEGWCAPTWVNRCIYASTNEPALDYIVVETYRVA